MAMYEFEDLRIKYENFNFPIVVIEVNGKNIYDKSKALVINDIDIDLSSGFEASVASFHIYNCFDMKESKYLFDDVKDFIAIGSTVKISTGYSNAAQSVFCGVITKVNFLFDRGGIPYIRVTAMDVKGIMMASCYAQQLKALNYGDAVKEIFERTAYSKQMDKLIKTISVTDTPDKGKYNEQEVNDFSIEMVNESDYEFVVKAAKKFNYEFFSHFDEVIFRPARSNTDIILQLKPSTGLFEFDIEYDVTGLVEQIEVRGMDTGKGKIIASKEKFTNKISEGNKAKNLITKSRKVFIDPTVKSQSDSDIRAKALMENMSYRFGTLSCTTIGLPEIMPGFFIELTELGTAASNKFYVSEVRHVINDIDGYSTYVKGQAASLA